jgi:hypothetical protein
MIHKSLCLKTSLSQKKKKKHFGFWLFSPCWYTPTLVKSTEVQKENVIYWGTINTIQKKKKTKHGNNGWVYQTRVGSRVSKFIDLDSWWLIK